MKKAHLLIAILLASFLLQAQNDTIRPPRLKVGVVLCGGGAKGASHIGALKYIEEMGIPIDYVAGTSMGSIIGGLYALGYSPDELATLIADMNWSEYIGNKIDRPFMSEESRQRNSALLLQVPFSHESLFDTDPNTKFISQLPSAYVNNSSLINLFNDLCVGYQEEMDFNDLPIPFACVATDMITGEEVVLRSGSVPTAMRASMAIPGVFSPVTIGDKVLVDGGLVNNFPADVLQEMGADIIIGVEITSTKEVSAADLKSLPQVFARLVINTTSSKRVENRKKCDVIIVPDISGFGTLSFTSEAIDTLVSRGYKRASDFHDQLLSIKQAVDASAGHPVSKTLRAPHAKNLANDSILIRSITFDNASNRDSHWLIRKGRLKVGNRYTENDIERAIKVYRGTGCYDEITYQVKESDSIHRDNQLSDAYDLSINMKPAMPHVFGLGVRYDTEEGAAILLNIGLNEKKFNGSKLNFSAKLSYNPRINFTYVYSMPSLANLNLAYDYRDEHFSMRFDNKRSINLRYYQHKMSGYISQFHLLNVSTNVGLSYTSTDFDLFTMDEEFDAVYFAPNRMLTPFFDVKYDNLDDAYFAKHGIKARLVGRYNIDTKNFKDKYPELSLSFQSYITTGGGRFTFIPQVYGHYMLGSPLYFNLYGLFGGQIEGRHFEQQMPFIGYASVESGSDVLSVLRCDLRYNFYKKHYLTVMYNQLINSYWGEPILEWFNNSAEGAGLQYSYNSFLGPVSLTAHWSRRYSENYFGAYFSFGYNF
ncbi:MAG: patatin-like phospholipase family protein [Bacteroidales bacterium]|nr:patatin-like phospholipase family protein [Bacteroidales bacterium]